MELTVDQVKRAAKREDFRAGVQMRLVMPRLSVRLTRLTLAYTRLTPNQITIVSLLFGVVAAAAYTAANPLVVLLGLLAFHVHVLLDYVDGEVARCRQLTSVQVDNPDQCPRYTARTHSSASPRRAASAITRCFTCSLRTMRARASRVPSTGRRQR